MISNEVEHDKWIRRVVLDTSVLVALIDANDKFHSVAQALIQSIQAAKFEEIYLDCVLIETIGVLCRRAEEQRRSHQVSMLLDVIEQKVSAEVIMWLGNELEAFYQSAVDLVRQTSGKLNFNDVLISLICREREIDVIASFDQDFDQISWLRRISKSTDIQSDNISLPSDKSFS